jgi:hypothetical protein
MSIASGIDFLLGKNKLQMYDEYRKFAGKLKIVLTINAISENQASRYMLQDKDLGLGNQDSCPWRECKTNRTTGFWRLLPMNWEAPSVLRQGSSHCSFTGNLGFYCHQIPYIEKTSIFL